MDIGLFLKEDQEIEILKEKYNLKAVEVHTLKMLKIIERGGIDFNTMKEYIIKKYTNCDKNKEEITNKNEE